LFNSKFPVVLKTPKIQRMPDFDDKFAHEGPPCHLPVQVSTAQQDESKNYVICQGDMYTVAKKVILSVQYSAFGKYSGTFTFSTFC
jgi:hypothetical protein